MKFPRIISSFLNPFFITFYFFIITLNLNTKAINPLPEKAKWIIYGLIIIITYVIPGLFIKFYGSFIQRFFKYGQKEKRIIYFFIVTVFYYLTYYLLIQLRLSPIYSLFLFGCTSLLVLCLIVSFFWNISIYMVAIGALSGLRSPSRSAISRRRLPNAFRVKSDAPAKIRIKSPGLELNR